MAKNRRKARKDSYLSKRKAKNKRFLKTVFGLVLVSSVGFLYLNSSMNDQNEKMTTDIKSSQKKLENIKTEIDGLKEDYEMRNTDQFKEKVAKEKLGMVKKGEDETEENSVIKPIDQTNNQNKNPENPNSGNKNTEDNQSNEANSTTGADANGNQSENPADNTNQDSETNINTGVNPNTNENGR